MNSRLRKKTFLYWGFALLPLLAVLTVGIGPSDIGMFKSWQIIISQLGLSSWQPSSTEIAIVWSLRLPRVILTMLVGGGLSVCGGVLQAFFRNSLADPYIIGVSSGAALGSGIAAVFMSGAGFLGQPLLAFIFALLTVYLVYGISRKDNYISSNTLLLTGVALASFLSAVMTFLLIFNTEHIDNIYFWLLGSLSGAAWSKVRVILPIVLAGSVILFSLSRYLNALLFGSMTAKHLGVPVENIKKLILLLTALVVAGCVAVCGPIGFVGLIIPHVVRLFTGPDHRILLPVSFWLGAVFLLVTDTVARLIFAPMEIPIGAITALFGAPFFIYLVRRRQFKGY
ncbi:MAG: FecCD family ABC transporter permease [Bacillota bacterium]|jgi:iron complex transport system permease protein